MQTSTKAILVAIAICLVLLSFAIAYIYLYIPSLYSKQAIEEKSREGHAQGLASGHGHDQAWCLDEAFRRAGNKTLEARNAGPWLYGCLESSAPTPDFCTGIEPPSEHPDLDRQHAVCRARGLGEYCLFYMSTMEAFCHAPIARNKGKWGLIKSPDAR